MMLPKKFIGAMVLLCIGAGVLVGCGSSEESHTVPQERGVDVFVVDVNGRQIPCIRWDGYHEGGISCDWGQK